MEVGVRSTGRENRARGAFCPFLATASSVPAFREFCRNLRITSGLTGR